MPVTERTRARPALSITTPSLTRHVVVFFPARKPNTERYTAAQNEPLNDETTRELLERYVTFLLEIAERNDSLDGSSPAEMQAILKKSLSQRSSFGICLGQFLDLKLRVLIVLYAEHFTLTYILDNDCTRKNSHPLALKVVDHVEHFADFISDQLKTYEQETLATYRTGEYVYKMTALQVGADRETYSNDILYREVWVALDIYLRNNIFALELGDENFENFDDIMRGDNRGLVITASHDSASQFVDGQELFAGLQRPSSPLGPLTEGQMAKRPCIKRSLDIQREFFATTLGLDATLHYVGGHQPRMKWDSNAVLCYISDKAAIYGAGLVLLPERRSTRLDAARIRNKQYDYVRTFIIYDGTNDYQLGRLVRRLYVLAELRAMAFVERRQVTSAHDALRELGHEVSDVIDDMTGTYGARGRTKSETLDTGRLDFIVDNFNKVSRGKRFDDNENDNVIVFDRGGKSKVIRFRKCHGGLSYRISRSRYYYDSYLSRIEDLSIGEIKGFQSYDRFVLRNYNQQMEAMLSIGERNLALGVRVDRAISISHPLQQRKVTQYALLVALLLSIFPALSLMLNVISYYTKSPGGNPISLLTLLLMFCFILVFLSKVYFWAENRLKSDGLYVKIENKYGSVDDNDFSVARGYVYMATVITYKAILRGIRKLKIENTYAASDEPRSSDFAAARDYGYTAAVFAYMATVRKIRKLIDRNG